MDLSRQVVELVTLTRDKMGDDAAVKVGVAAELAMEMHEGQVRRLDGSPYVTHCFRVAKLCLEWGLWDVAAICSALLHDTIEDASVDLEPERRVWDFDPLVGEQVVALSKIRNLATGAGDMPATYRRILSAAAKDLRVLLVKTFDVMDNAETLEVHGRDKAKVKASMGLIYVGVARRLGIMGLSESLIDLLLPHIMPMQYQKAIRSLESLQRRNRESMERFTGKLKEVMSDGILLDFVLEPKKIADFFYLTEAPGTGRLRRVGLPVHRLRLVVADDDLAWRVLGRMHRTFGPLPRHVRDYFNAPRINGFRALTTRILWEGNPLSVHVVREQDLAANRQGILADWSHQGPGAQGPDLNRYLRLLATLGDSDLRMSEVHAHVLPDLLDVYSPKGDRFTFPVGSNVVDFAYLVHTELGEHCVGAHVNGIRRPPEHPLADGDVVSVITAKNARPVRAWLDIVKTARARTLIKQSLRSPDIPVKGVERIDNEGFLLTALTAPDILWSPCCLPVPPDRVVGRLSNDGRWIVHCARCLNVHSDQWDFGSWAVKPEAEILNVTFSLTSHGGGLLPVLELLANRGITGHSIQSRGLSAGTFTITMELGGREPVLLGKVLKELMSVPSVQEIRQFHWRT